WCVHSWFAPFSLAQDVGVGGSDTAGFGADGPGHVFDGGRFLVGRGQVVGLLEEVARLFGAAGNQQQVALHEEIAAVGKRGRGDGPVERRAVDRNRRQDGLAQVPGRAGRRLGG